MADPDTFKESNLTLTAPIGQPDVLDLQVHRCQNEGGYEQVISKWKLSWRERLSALFYGSVWLFVRGETQPPIGVTATETVFIETTERPELVEAG